MIETIIYKEQEFPLICDYYALSRAKSDKDNDNSIKELEVLVYYSIEAGCEALNKPFTIKKGDKEFPLTVKDCAFMIGIVGAEEINKKLAKFFENIEDKEGSKKK